MNNKYLQLYSSSKLVKGKDRGAIYILDENKIEIVPLSLINIIELLNKYSIEECRKLIDSQEVFNEYLDFIVSKRIGFITTHRVPIDSIDEYYDTPSYIFSSCIEMSEKSDFDLRNIINELDELLCKHLELRLLYDNLSEDKLSSILDCIKNTTIRSINLYIKSVSNQLLKNLSKTIKKYKKVSYVVLFSMQEDKIQGDLVYTTKRYRNIVNKPFNDRVLFINIRFFTEGKKYNPFYYKKISINEIGEIKNNLICKKSFGKYCPLKNSLQQIIKSDDFTKFWEVGVDKIDCIKDSELRYAIFPSYEIEQKNGKYYFKKD